MPRSRAVPRRWGAEFTGDVLEVTGGGRARDFATSRDHALIWILRSEGIRRAELLGMVMHSLPADVIKAPLLRLVPLKSARAAGEGRLISLAPASARASGVPSRAPAPQARRLRLGMARHPRQGQAPGDRPAEAAGPQGEADRVTGVTPHQSGTPSATTG
jgi:hypothetical protein